MSKKPAIHPSKTTVVSKFKHEATTRAYEKTIRCLEEDKHRLEEELASTKSLALEIAAAIILGRSSYALAVRATDNAMSPQKETQ